jgi:peptidoglycan/LPS O-acetylase OafA/YrhL
MPPKKHFWHRLESLRGIFALSVAVHHSLAMIHGHEFTDKIIRGLQGVFYGQGAVLSFFILSGLVLGQSLRRSAPGNIFRPFYVRRFFRIYPALIVSLLLASALVAFAGFGKVSSPAMTVYYDEFYHFSLSPGLFLKNLFLCDFSLNNVTWTLWIEIIGSLFLPFMHVVSTRAIYQCLLMLALVGLQFSPVQHVFNDAFSYLWIFYVGYLIPLFLGKPWDYLMKRKMALPVVVLASMAICLLTPHFGHHVIPYVLAMAVIIACVYHLPEEPLFSFLDNQVVRLYGRISYSFYVLHFLVVYWITDMVFSHFAANLLIDHALATSFLLAVVSIAIATPVANLSYLFVEKPFIRLGKKWTEPAHDQ